MLFEILLCLYTLVGIIIFIRVQGVIASKLTHLDKVVETICYILAGIIAILAWPIFLGIT